jgi:hypothetical protein
LQIILLMARSDPHVSMLLMPDLLGSQRCVQAMAYAAHLQSSRLLTGTR